VNYANPDPSYGGNPYPAAYPMNPVRLFSLFLALLFIKYTRKHIVYGCEPPAFQQVPGTADGGPQYAAGAGSAPGHGSWGSYDMQRTHVRR